MDRVSFSQPMNILKSPYLGSSDRTEEKKKPAAPSDGVEINSLPPLEMPRKAVETLASGFGYAEFPQVSPDGKTLVFNVVGDYVTSQMLVMDSDGGTVRSLFTGEKVTPENIGAFMEENKGNIAEQGTWSKDGRHIYYRTSQNGTFDVGRFDIKTGKKEIVVADDNLNMKHPVELEDGRVAGYGGPPGDKYKTVDKYSDIWIADPSKGTYALITHTDGSVAYKHPAPFGDKILAHKEPKGGDTEAADLVILDPKTGEETNLTNTPNADERHVFFNKKVGLLTYHSDGSGDKNLWLSTPDGKQKCQLTHYSKPAQSPCWSPDGRKIYFVRKNEKQAEGEDFYVRQADIRVIDVKDALKDLKEQSKDRIKTLKSMDADKELVAAARKEYENYKFFLEKYEK